MGGLKSIWGTWRSSTRWAKVDLRRRKNEKTKKDMECKMDVAFQELKKKMEALHESFTELQDTKQSELEGLRTHLEKNKGNKVEEIVWSVKSRLKKYLRQFSHGIRTLEENIEDWSETTEYELQRLRAELQKNKEEVEIVWSLKSRLKKYLRQLSHGIQSLKENVEDLSETIEYELQCLRPELEKNKGKKEDESSNFCMETKVPQLSYRIQTLDPELQERWEFPNHELQFVTAGLENSQELFQPFQIKDLGEAPGPLHRGPTPPRPALHISFSPNVSGDGAVEHSDDPQRRLSLSLLSLRKRHEALVIGPCHELQSGSSEQGLLILYNKPHLLKPSFRDLSSTSIHTVLESTAEKQSLQMNNLVTAVVGFIEDTFQVTPNPDEVSEVFVEPLEYFVRPLNYKTFPYQASSGYLTRIHCFTYDDQERKRSFKIWGLTAHFAVFLALVIFGERPTFEVDYDLDNLISSSENNVINLYASICERKKSNL
ncbi:hypothetical protein DUI87_35468 [Hirundo rustica rustica]|uniref:Uncharacterized protein n=1 Tax=Hirundo rustica rustica TaxID=333673 RepID=A0A3M0IHC2_HIRRU|nr:hypothetical protein DUI87_35468 [Hirundo rustica rustica]